MYKLLVIISLLYLSCSVLKAQNYKGVQVYAYQQPVVIGTQPQTAISEGGETVALPPKKNYNLWIYMSFPRDIEIRPSEVYVNGIKHTITITALSKTPVMYTSHEIPSEPKTVVLVPETVNKVLQLTPSGSSVFTPKAVLKKLIKENELVISYEAGAKNYYSVVKKMNRMEPEMMQ